MKRFLLLASLLSVALATQAGAAVTFGTDTEGPVSDVLSGCAIPAAATARSCTVLQTYASGPGVAVGSGLRAPTNGVITSWTTAVGSASGAKIAVTPQILRPVSGPGIFDLHYVADRHGITHDLGTTGGGGPFADRLPVAAGDSIAVRIDLTEGAPGDAPYAHGTVPLGSSGNIIQHFPAAEDGSSIDASGIIAVSDEVFRVNATLEPDVDNDGYGDESQDGCPQRADTHGACPAVKLSGGGYEDGSIKFTADSPGTYKLKIERAVPGHKKKGKCSTKARSGKKCTAYKRILSLSGPISIGANKLKYRGKPGKYRVTITTLSAQGVPGKKTIKFSIKKPKKKRR